MSHPTLMHQSFADADLSSRVIVALYRADHVSGINATARRMATMPSPHARWVPLMVGEGLDPGATSLPGFGDMACRVATWAPEADPVTQSLSVLAALRDLNASIVIPNDLPHGFIAAGLDHHAGLRCAAWLHADDLNGDELVERCGRLADAWRAVSPEIHRRAGTLGTLPSRVDAEHVPCPVDVPAVPSRVTPHHGLNLLYAGRLERFQKRVLDLAVLCDALLALDVPFHLRIAGRGPADAELRERLASHLHAGRVTMLGAVAADCMHTHYAWCDALVLVSAYEGTPVVGMEAMAAGRPVIATTGAGGLVPVIRAHGCGHITDVGDMGAMAESIASFTSESLARTGVHARAAALSLFSPVAIGPAIDRWMLEAAAGSLRLDVTDPGSISAHWTSILRAIEAIGPCSQESLRTLATLWLGRIGRPQMAGALATWFPPLPGPRERMFLAAVDRLASRGLGRIALYGAGQHTRRLERAIASRPEIIAVIDDCAGEPSTPQSIGGRSVVPPAAAQSLRADVVLISSDEHEQTLISLARRWAVEGHCDAPIIPLYGPRPTIGLRPEIASASLLGAVARRVHATRRAG